MTTKKNNRKNNRKTIKNFLNKKRIMNEYSKVNYIKLSHNCYAFLMDAFDYEGIERCKKSNCNKPQPGYISGIEHWNSTELQCDKIMERVIKDSNDTIYIPKVRIPGTNKYKYGKTCKSGYYKGVLVIAPNRDYHFYREIKKDEWLHKRGQTDVLNTDASGKKISDPKYANRNYGGDLNYSVFCCYFCIPYSASKRQVSSYVRKIKKNTEKYINNKYNK